MNDRNSREDCFIAFTFNHDRSTPDWIAGSVGLFIRGCQIGDIAEESMSLLVPAFERVANRRGDRVDHELYLMDAKAALQRVHHALFVDDSRTDAEVDADSVRYSPFQALPLNFDPWRGWFAILVEWENAARFVYSDPSGAVHAIELRAGEFERAIGQFVASLASTAVIENSP